MKVGNIRGAKQLIWLFNTEQVKEINFARFSKENFRINNV